MSSEITEEKMGPAVGSIDRVERTLKLALYECARIQDRLRHPAPEIIAKAVYEAGFDAGIARYKLRVALQEIEWFIEWSQTIGGDTE